MHFFKNESLQKQTSFETVILIALLKAFLSKKKMEPTRLLSFSSEIPN